MLSALRVDPFRAAAKRRGYDVTIELRANMEPTSFSRAFEDLADDLSANPGAELSASAIVVGRDYVFTPSAPQPIRFQYLMRRRADYPHEAYAKRYAEVHSEFGMRTQGIEGYVQFHIDPLASQEAARAAGFGGCSYRGSSRDCRGEYPSTQRSVST